MATVDSAIASGSFPSEIQEKTLTQGQLLTTRRNLILNAPTILEKTLLAYLALFRAAIEEKRALLLVPLRAIAEEKYERTQLEHSLKSVFGKKIGVTISTGAIDWMKNPSRVHLLMKEK